MPETELKKALEFTCSEVQPCVKKVEYTLSSDSVKKEMDSILREYAAHVELPGFRKGKAPAGMVKNRFQPQIEEEFLRRFFSTAFEKFSDNDEMDVVSFSMPDKSKPVINPGETFKFTVNFDVAPELKLPEYKSVKVQETAVSVSEKDIADRVDYYRNMYAEYLTIDGPAQKGDMIKISYSSDFPLSDSIPAGVKYLLASDGNWFWLDEPEMIPGSVKAFDGASKNKEVAFAAEFPADHHHAELAGKKVSYTAKVLEIQRKTPLASDEKLCEKMKVKSMDEIKGEIEKAMASEKKQEAKTEMKKQVFETIEKQVPDFPFPPSMLNAETEKELKNIAVKVVKSNEDMEKFKQEKDKHMEEARKTAADRLRRFFILKKIAKAENIRLEENEVENAVYNMGRYYGYKNHNDFKRMVESKGIMEDLEMDILMSKTLDFLLEKAEVSGK